MSYSWLVTYSHYRMKDWPRLKLAQPQTCSCKPVRTFSPQLPPPAEPGRREPVPQPRLSCPETTLSQTENVIRNSTRYNCPLLFAQQHTQAFPQDRSPTAERNRLLVQAAIEISLLTEEDQRPQRPPTGRTNMSLSTCRENHHWWQRLFPQSINSSSLTKQTQKTHGVEPLVPPHPP